MLSVQKDQAALAVEVKLALQRDIPTLTTDVRALVKTVGDLALMVTEAKAPRRVDWFPLVGMIVSVIVLVMAIGSAVIVPLSNQVALLKESQERQRERTDVHTALPLHPMGATRVDALERLSLLLTEQLRQNLDTLDKKLQRETELTTANAKREVELAHANVVSRVADLDLRLQKEFGLTQDRNVARLAKLETIETGQVTADKEELRQWRLQAMRVLQFAPKPVSGP